MSPVFVRSIRSRRVLTPEGMRAAAIEIENGVIAAINPWDSASSDVLDVGDAIVMPGLVDTHVHVNEPGRTDWEGFETATRAAAAGGVTTLLDMPLNSIPATTTRLALDEKIRAATGKCWVNVGFLGGVIPRNAAELSSLWSAGVFGFKCFLVPSGVDEFPSVLESDLRLALPSLSALGAPLMVHAELLEHLREPEGDGRQYANYLASRPPVAESRAIELIASLAREYGARVHIVHVSSADSIGVIRRARESGVAISAETCPHYLIFAGEDIPDGATEFKCAPPIRSSSHRDALWAALGNGDLEMIVSDHSPCPPSLKSRGSGDFFSAWGGISSLQLGLGAVWEGGKSHGLSLPQLVEWMSAAPARLVGLAHRKGMLAPGFDADVVVWDPAVAYRVSENALFHRHRLTPYLGSALHGRVLATIVAGKPAYLNGDVSAEPVGRIHLRDERILSS